ncbi:MAG: hypothetical protein ACTSYD_07435 [Candidatus Heimdallarchaeaceae archaeon]
MKKKTIIVSTVILIGLLFVTLAPTNASTQWGVTADTDYKFVLNKFLFFGSDMTPFIRDNVSATVIFKEFNDTGYVYDLHPDVGEAELGLSTNFEEVDTGFANVTLPVGLPVAIPLAIGDISDYPAYIGDFVNQTTCWFNSTIFTELNITEIGENITLTSYSTLDQKNLNIHVDMYADRLNDSLLTMLMENADFGDLPITLPSNITNFKLNASISFSVTTGLFNSLTIIIRSDAMLYGYPTNFNVDVDYSYKPPEEPTSTSTPTTTPRTTESPYPVFATIVATMSFGVLARKLRKRL